MPGAIGVGILQARLGAPSAEEISQRAEEMRKLREDLAAARAEVASLRAKMAALGVDFEEAADRHEQLPTAN